MNRFQLRSSAVLWGCLLVACASIIYSATLQVEINGSDVRYAEDTGEFQNVLARWGTAHPTGYPLYSLTGAAFASVLRVLGVPAATAASAFSAVVAVLALLGVYVLVSRWRLTPPLAAATAVLLAVTFPFWIHATLAEVYVLLIALIVWLFVIATRWQASRDARDMLALAFVLGLAVGHHRLALLALPALAILIGPLFVGAVRERPLRLLVAGLSFVTAFLVYLYLPIRAWMGSDWVYDNPGTWEGFWRLVTAREYGALVRPTANLGATETGLAYVINTLAAGLTWPVLIAGTAGLLAGLRDPAQRRPAAALAVLAATVVAFASVFSQAVFMPAALLPSMVALTVGVGFATQVIADRGRLAAMAATGALAIGVIALMGASADPIRSITRDPHGREVIERVAQARLDEVSQRPVVFALWGLDYFALAYAHGVTGELASIELVDHRADVKALIDSGHDLYILSPTFYYDPRSLAWWTGRLGRVYLSSFAGDLVRVSNRPILSEADLPRDAVSIPMGESIALRGWQVEPDAADRVWYLTLYWQALSQPERDYSVFVHASDRAVIDSSDAIVAQADSSAPVYGWYPTSRWSPGEIVRDDYTIHLPPGRTVKIVSVGMYYQEPPGTFHNVGQHTIALPALP